MVKLILKQGGIPFLKSNIPMMLKTFETNCNIYGRCKNPWNTAKTSGGSSGGEASLISSYCSPAGIGGDIGGSIRQPCAYTGIYGLKPTSNRQSLSNSRIVSNSGSKLASSLIRGSFGPMARSVEDLLLLYKTLQDEEITSTDSTVFYSPWNEKMFTSNKNFKIGRPS